MFVFLDKFVMYSLIAKKNKLRGYDPPPSCQHPTQLPTLSTVIAVRPLISSKKFPTFPVSFSLMNFVGNHTAHSICFLSVPLRFYIDKNSKQDHKRKSVGLLLATTSFNLLYLASSFSEAD